MHRAKGIEIAVWLLSGSDSQNYISQPFLKIRIGSQGEAIGGALDNLKDVRIIKRKRRCGRITKKRLALSPAGESLGRQIKIAQALR